jgi:predicted nucleotidyltransferase
VIVLGSRVKDSWTPRSDVDVTIIADRLPRDGKNFFTKRILGFRRNFLLSDRPLYLGVEPSGCCSRKEFLERLNRFDIQALDAVLYGKIIYDDGFWSMVEARYATIEKRYQIECLPLKEMLASI